MNFIMSIVLTISFKISLSSGSPILLFCIYLIKKNPYTKGSATENIKNINNKRIT
ncbi:hypothetical protein BC30090_2320 [Bacillus cereus]|nr:hypothetical protein BC30090_2320 [Bacillus cereus]